MPNNKTKTIIKRKKTNTFNYGDRQTSNKTLHIQSHSEIRKMYKELKKLDGYIKSPIVNASTTIDEVLYGENGAWKDDHV